jgi:hypothetical protein
MNKTKIIAVLTSCLMLVINNCSLIGYGAGSIIDETTPKQKVITSWQIGSIKEGTPTIIVSRDSTLYAGAYDGLSEIDTSIYVPRYDSVRSSCTNEISLPRIGRNLQVFAKNDFYARDKFFGFRYEYDKDPKVARKISGGHDFQYVSLIIDARTTRSSTYTNNITEIVNQDGSRVSGYRLLKLVEQGKIPIMTEVSLSYGDSLGENTFDIAFENIAYVKVPRKRNVRWILLATGLIIDVIWFSTWDWGWDSGPMELSLSFKGVSQ